MLALTFATPLLLIGLLAAAIPPLLHLLSRARAKEVPFPTLRFLRLSMDRTARRRRVQQWLLMALRCGVLALLAVGVAEPISRAAGGWLAATGGSAVIVLDNSMSMSAAAGKSSRLAEAKREAVALLDSPARPALAGLLTTNGGANPGAPGLTSRLDLLRENINGVPPSLGRAAMAQRVQAAATMLNEQAQGQGKKTICVFSDLQQVSFKELAALPIGAAGGPIDLWIVNTASRPANDVAVSDVHLGGQAVANAVVTLTAQLVNSGPAERVVDVRFQTDEAAEESPAHVARADLAAGGSAAARASVRFQHRFAQAGWHTGKVTVEQDDDLPADNVRYFCLSVADSVETLVVAGGDGDLSGRQADSGGSAAALMLALNPFGNGNGDANVSWPIRPHLVRAERFVPADLGKVSAAFFCNVPAFSPATAEAIRQFVRAGGTATIFLGPNVQVDNYNQLLGSPAGEEGALLPGKLSPAVGQIGPQAPATSVEFVDTGHPYLAGLYEKPTDYMNVLVQRYFPLAAEATSALASSEPQPNSAAEPSPARVLMRLAGGGTLLTTKPYGRGAVILCATSASPQWSNLPLTGLFLPMVSRICLASAPGSGADQSYPAGAAVRIQLPNLSGAAALPAKATVDVTPPSTDDAAPAAISVPIAGPPEAPQAVFTATDQAGVYRWKVSAAAAGKNALTGAFAINPDGTEGDLTAMDAGDLQKALVQAGWRSVSIGRTAAEVQSAATAAAAGHDWWDLLAALVIVLLVVEAVVANRRPAAAPSPEVQRSAGESPWRPAGD